jgi:hypothetical protein
MQPKSDYCYTEKTENTNQFGRAERKTVDIVLPVLTAVRGSPE